EFRERGGRSHGLRDSGHRDGILRDQCAGQPGCRPRDPPQRASPHTRTSRTYRQHGTLLSVASRLLQRRGADILGGIGGPYGRLLYACSCRESSGKHRKPLSISTLSNGWEEGELTPERKRIGGAIRSEEHTSELQS